MAVIIDLLNKCKNPDQNVWRKTRKIKKSNMMQINSLKIRVNALTICVVGASLRGGEMLMCRSCSSPCCWPFYSWQNNKWVPVRTSTYYLTLRFSEGDGRTWFGGVADTVLVDGARPEAVLLILGQVKDREPGRVHHHVQTGQSPAAPPCQGLIQVQH